MSSQQRPSSWSRLPPCSEPFGAQLWKAVGLQQQLLCIPREHFFQETATRLHSSSLPSTSSREASDRSLAHVYTHDCAGVDAHKRRRASANCPGNCFQEYAEVAFACDSIPDLDAIASAPRRHRTGKRRPVAPSDVQRLIADFRDSANDATSAGRSERESRPGDEAPSAQDVGASGSVSPEESQPAWQSVDCCNTQAAVLVARVAEPGSMCEALHSSCKATLLQGKVSHRSPASHSAESSQGVFGGPVSPLHDFGSGDSSKQQHQQRWSPGSPVSDDAF